MLLPLLFLAVASALGAPPVDLPLSRALQSGATMPFVSRGPALALNLPYAPIRALRPPIERAIGRPLDFLRAWSPQGEAHVTVVTPPEFEQALRAKLTIAEIDAIARRLRIQSSDLRILGLGSARLPKAGQPGPFEESFFVLVDSENLRRIRHAIHEEFVRRGGNPAAFDPTWFFPHVTVGYTLRDLHESDGVMKNLRSSFDPRFALRATP